MLLALVNRDKSKVFVLQASFQARNLMGNPIESFKECQCCPMLLFIAGSLCSHLLGMSGVTGAKSVKGHNFHSSKVEVWLDNGRSCPILLPKMIFQKKKKDL